MVNPPIQGTVIILFGRALLPGVPLNNQIIAFDSGLNLWKIITNPGGTGVQTSSNVGSGAGLALLRVLDDLPFKSLVENAEVKLTPSATEIVFSIGAIVQSKITGLVSALATKIDTVINVGAGVGKVFRDKVGTTMNLKSILAGAGISIINNADTIEITSSQKSFILNCNNTETFVTGDRFLNIAGSVGSRDVVQKATTIMPNSGTLSRLTMRVSAQRDQAQTVTLQKNEVDGNQSLTIPANTIGDFQDITNTDDYVNLDRFALKVVTAGVGTFQSVATALENSID